MRLVMAVVIAAFPAAAVVGLLLRALVKSVFTSAGLLASPDQVVHADADVVFLRECQHRIEVVQL